MRPGFLPSILSACCFGTLAILVKAGLARGLAPLEIIQLRFLVGVILLFAFYGLTRPSILRATPRTLARAALLGACIYPFQSWCFVKALSFIPASTTSLLYYLYPLTATLMAWGLFRERIERSTVLSLALVTLGCGLVFADALFRDMDMRGVAFALATTLIFSLYLNLIQLALRGEQPQTLSLYVLLFAALTFSSLTSPLKILSLDREGLALALLLGLVPTALAVSLIYRAIEKAGSAVVSVFSTLEPITTLALSVLVLDESLAAWQVGGVALIALGVALPNLRFLRAGQAPSAQ